MICMVIWGEKIVIIRRLSRKKWIGIVRVGDLNVVCLGRNFKNKVGIKSYCLWMIKNRMREMIVVRRGVCNN